MQVTAAKSYGAYVRHNGQNSRKPYISYRLEDDILPSWDDANEGDVIAVFMNFSDYVINTNMEMQVVKWTDHDNNKIKNKCLMVADGKVADAAGIILVKKGVKSV